MDSSKIHFCVITPTYNRIDYLPEAIASVQAQVKAPHDFTFEHLICENGCTDRTNAWLSEAVKQEGAAIRFWSHDTKILPGPARNMIIPHAPEGSWIVPLDDDDVMLQRNLYNYADLIQRNPGQQWFVNDFLRMDHEKRYLAGDDYYAWKFKSPAEMLGAIFRGEHFIQGNVCYSKSLYDEVGGYDQELKMAEDLDLYVKFLLAGHLPVISPHISHLHRYHTNNISIGVDAKKHREDVRGIYKRYEEKLQKLGVDCE